MGECRIDVACRRPLGADAPAKATPGKCCKYATSVNLAAAIARSTRHLPDTVYRGIRVIAHSAVGTREVSEGRASAGWHARRERWVFLRASVGAAGVWPTRFVGTACGTSLLIVQQQRRQPGVAAGRPSGKLCLSAEKNREIVRGVRRPAELQILDMRPAAFPSDAPPGSARFRCAVTDHVGMCR